MRALLRATAEFCARDNRTPDRVRSIIGAHRIPHDLRRCTYAASRRQHWRIRRFRIEPPGAPAGNRYAVAGTLGVDLAVI